MAAYLVRSQYSSVKGKVLITRTFRRFMLRKYLLKIGVLYADAKRGNQWGRGACAQWPAAPIYARRS